MKKKLVHRSKWVDGSGNVAACCYKTKRRIDLGRVSWTLRDEAVTCPACKKRMSEPAKEVPRDDVA